MLPKMDLLLGIDVGTTSTRVAIYGSMELCTPVNRRIKLASETGWQSTLISGEKLMSVSQRVDPLPPKTSISDSHIDAPDIYWSDRHQQPIGPAILWYDVRHHARLTGESAYPG
jgi:sugar (pentulose or hexulose) kinase